GLYRYQLNDIIEVTDFYNQIPCIKFVGKADNVSDYFGEKLNEQFVASVLKDLFEKHKLNPVFYMLAPDDTSLFHYTLYLELPNRLTTQLNDDITTQLDNTLRANFHYDYCRKLGQLAESQIVQVKNGSSSYIRVLQQRGKKLGNIKPSILQKSTGWGGEFEILN
ncbi:MAG: GH3 auxin-responsive promoter family protein, partial [Anaerolineales bacterium]|nr:GH3 auxin-responsive promoter family protein [Anaerolineales bacterium]